MPKQTATTSDARVGQVFAGRYEILRRIGTGGMAVVYAGRDRMLQRDVALKILKPSAMDDASAPERLRREARAAGQLHHRHIITFHDVGESEGVIFIVMELLRGHTLAAERRKCQRLPALRVARVGAQVASALKVVHAAGIIHRDLKPDNVFLIDDAGDDFAKLLDFSIAKLPSTLVDGRITQTGTVHGTPRYMPPEQAMGDPVSPASDIYALGAVLFEMLVGRAPFHANNVVELLTVQSTEDAPLVRTLEPDCPAMLEELVARMLARQPRRRPATADEVERELARVVEHCVELGDAPPPLPSGSRKRLPEADKTSAQAYEPTDFDAPLSDASAGDAATGPMPSTPVRAPSALDFAVRPATADDPSAGATPAVSRPKSVRTRAVARRTGAAALPPRPGSDSRRVARASTRSTSGAGLRRPPSATSDAPAADATQSPAAKPARRGGRTPTKPPVQRARGRGRAESRSPTAAPKPDKTTGGAAGEDAAAVQPNVAPDDAKAESGPPSLPTGAAARAQLGRQRRSTIPRWSGQDSGATDPKDGT